MVIIRANAVFFISNGIGIKYLSLVSLNLWLRIVVIIKKKEVTPIVHVQISGKRVTKSLNICPAVKLIRV